MGHLRSRKKSWRKKPPKKQNGPKTSIVLEPHQVIVRPVVTEKNMVRANVQNQYTFEVSTLATKDDVRRAVEALWDVKVVKICTQNRKGKPRRHRFRSGRTSDWKKAIVTLGEDHRIDFF
jgi:large subunit ribosomal protein L23